ncbi:MAG: methyltransferase [Candidatus Odinarchaeota archaeon]
MSLLKTKISSKLLELLHARIKPGVYVIDGKKFYLTNEVFNPKYAFTSKFIVENMIFKPDWSVLDMGAGSGYIAVQIADKVRNVVAVDVNHMAVRCCRVNVNLNGLKDKIKVYQSEFFSALKNEKFNTIIFNPPYLRGEPKNLIQQAWLNRSPENLISRFVKDAKKYLFKRGYIQIAYSNLSGVNLVKKIFERNSFKLIRERQRKLLWETLNFLIFQCKP